ncbi:putative DNA-binding protein with PD1-like motif [Sedimentibacter acidaminivorans]|uniref:DNA-binding protein with PD1-like motif n=1 Tax=Sedimentibacter acidaminivorans TaxID=913099 RepID=A0ABS4GE36_9FIRM|nr:PPC domain-containing DNA-binding protein [Sedimentibacter acidaminivorans]MBP1925907.1 putative DNA-binding protein with PD1-like motif [Sedimentibacter acidaminivorans]
MNAKEHTKESNIGRVIVGRIPRGVDLITGIKEICKEYSIKCGYISMFIGSLESGRFIYAQPGKESKIGFKYSEPVDLEGPLEMLSSQGLIGLDVNGDLSVHLHMLVSDKYMRVYGGHFVEGGNIVAATGEIVIHEVENVELNRQFDEQTGFELFKVKAV